MINFLIKVFSFLMATLCLFGLFYLIPQKESFQSEYLKGMIDKHARLDSLPSPKLILAGGSNLAFGIESRQFEEVFSFPVVNLSINAALGQSFILEELNQSTQSGDIVLLSLEYFLGEGIEIMRTKASNTFPTASNYYNINFFTRLNLQLDYIKINLKDKIQDFILTLVYRKPLKTKNDIYSQNIFNKYGDVISHHGKPGKKHVKTHYLLYRYWEGIDKLNLLKQKLSKKNVSIFYFYPPCASSYYSHNEREIALLQQDLEKDLEIDIINKPTDMVYDDSLFFDTIYHLNEDGGKKRTKKMIELIKKHPKARQIIQSRR